ncbi:hypothetical protein [Desulfosporosinus sp. BG]|uniref:hypothetical protein n=1 Tax=Desulfosporosinus sp. BG TaxID=1633135 RepID=UPI0008558B8E|nr:hypothetical protein [Desulfosporosinus sp. BG]ODA39417.1 hypothetical protein DSBG_3802 [Desulfosporosinus sp. BG]
MNMLRSFIKLFDKVQKIGTMKDSITTGLLGGLIGTILMDLSNMVLYKIKKSEVTYGHIAGQFFVSPFRTKQRKNLILGELLHLAVGSVSGIPLLYMLKKTGKDHYLSKGLVTSMLTWGILYSGGQKVGLFKRLRLTKTHYSSVCNNTIYGLSAAKALVMLADPTIFASSNKINNGVSMQAKNDATSSDIVGVCNQFDQSLSSYVGYH